MPKVPFHIVYDSDTKEIQIGARPDDIMLCYAMLGMATAIVGKMLDVKEKPGSNIVAPPPGFKPM